MLEKDNVNKIEVQSSFKKVILETARIGIIGGTMALFFLPIDYFIHYFQTKSSGQSFTHKNVLWRSLLSFEAIKLIGSAYTNTAKVNKERHNTFIWVNDC